MASYSSESFYKGGDSSLEPAFSDFSNSYGHFTGFNKLKGHQIGINLNPGTSDQLGETLSAIRQGTKVFEIQLLGIQGDPDQVIPKQHFDEIRALSKLTGVKPSVHGPVMDAAGFTERGWGGEEARKQNERRMFDAIEKAHRIGPDRNINVTFHTGNAGGYSTLFKPDEKDEGKAVIDKLPVIDLKTKQSGYVEEKGQYHWGAKKEEFEAGKDDVEKGGSRMTPEEAIQSQNRTQWSDKIGELTLGKRYADQALNEALERAQSLKLMNMNIKTEEDVRKFNEELSKSPDIHNQLQKANILLEENYISFNGLFDTAYKYGTDKQRKKLRRISDEWREEEKRFRKKEEKEGFNELRDIVRRSKMQDIYLHKLNSITRRKAPQVHVDASKFAMRESAKTFGNLASKAYKKYGDKSPTVAIENVFGAMGFSTAKDHAKLIDMSRENFKKYLMKEEKKSEKEAEKISKKLIGATWDVGHANLAKGLGFDDKYVIEETKKIAPYVKHVHLTDNFGFNDSHLVPGMGNVPIKETLEALEKEGKIEEMQMIVEAGGFITHFKKPTHGLALSAFGTGVHSTGGYENWNQAAAMSGHYFGGFGTINPEIHHSIYGSGFTTMPMDLGGQMPGAQSRFSGNLMS